MSHALEQAIGDFLDDCTARNFSPYTLRAYRNALEKFASWAEAQGVTTIEAVTATLCRGYMKACLGLLSPGGTHARLRPLRTLCNWLETEEMLSKSPMKRVQLPSLPKRDLPAVREEDLRRLFAQAGKTRRPLRNQALLATLFDTGLRVSELCALTVQDLEGCGLRVKQGKGAKDRTVPISRLTLRHLRRYLDKERPLTDSPKLFLIDAHTPVNPQTVTLMLGALCKAAKLPNFTPHTFRRGFAVAFLQSGGNVFTLQRILGHTTLEMSNRYAALSTEDLKQSHRLASPLDKALRRR